jgi:guanosine-3',5'-bis(diphosphate) 3'-pyrophosphohydrolase
MTSTAQKPSPEWEGFVVTGKARAHVRRRVRAEARTEYLKLGHEILEKTFAKESLQLNDKGLKGVVDKLGAENVEDIFVKVGEGRLVGREVLLAVYPGARTTDDNIVNLSQARMRQSNEASGAIAIRGLTPGMAVHLSECCHPLPGDRIVGITGGGHGIDIHTIDCERLEDYTETPERWIDLAWDVDRDKDVHIGRINLVVANEPGSLGALSTVIARNFGNISNLKIVNRSKEFFEMIVDIEVRGVKHLTNIIAALRATAAINSVERARR